MKTFLRKRIEMYDRVDIGDWKPQATVQQRQQWRDSSTEIRNEVRQIRCESLVFSDIVSMIEQVKTQSNERFLAKFANITSSLDGFERPGHLLKRSVPVDFFALHFWA